MISTSLTGKFFECNPLFVEQKSIVFLSCGAVIHGMSLTTGESIYSLFGHISSVLSLSLHPTTDQYVSRLIFLLSSHFIIIADFWI